MTGFFSRLFDTSDFPARWHCGDWTAGHGWLHVTSDLATWGAYTAIPLVLAYFISRRKDLPFPKIVWLFVAFIFSCGSVHLMEAAIFWWPAYRFSGVLKATTAVVSWATVIALVPTVPRALAMRSPSELEREIDERKRAEEALRQSEERFEAAFEHAITGMAIAGLDGAFLQVNRALVRMLGYSPQELLRTDFQSVTHPDDVDEDLALLAEVLEGRRDTYQMDKRYLRQDGGVVWVRLGVAAVHADDGTISYLVGQMEDITQRKRALDDLRQLNAELEERVASRTSELEERSRELERSNEELERFAYAASHDLKAPLRGIQNLSSWIAEDLGDDLPEEVAAHVERLQQRVDRMERMIDDLLSYSRAGRDGGEEGRVDTAALAREVADLVEPPEGFDVVVAEAMPTVTLAAAPFQQVLTNLVNNAVKHHDRPDGRVEISARRLHGDWEFQVQDDGPGIPAEYHERVFEMFRTLKPRDRVEGTGLGLSLVRKIVESHGGRVRLESEGRGTTVAFTWPEARDVE